MTFRDGTCRSFEKVALKPGLTEPGARRTHPGMTCAIAGLRSGTNCVVLSPTHRVIS
jgi:hypothetical protein